MTALLSETGLIDARRRPTPAQHQAAATGGDRFSADFFALTLKTQREPGSFRTRIFAALTMIGVFRAAQSTLRTE